MPTTAPTWRVAIVSGLPRLAGRLAAEVRAHGHKVVGWVHHQGASLHEPPPELRAVRRAEARHRDHVGPMLRTMAPDLVLCWGFPWRFPEDALAVAPLGCVNQHFSPLPRHRGPQPLAWAARVGDDVLGATWHYMDAGIDSGNILAADVIPFADDDCTIEDVEPKLTATAVELLPRALARVAAGDPGDVQDAEEATWAPLFDADYATVDWSGSARDVHNQVRGWQLTYRRMRVPGPLADLDGRTLILKRTSLTARPAARRVACGDGDIWIVDAAVWDAQSGDGQP